MGSHNQLTTAFSSIEVLFARYNVYVRLNLHLSHFKKQFRNSWALLLVPLAAAQDYSLGPYYPTTTEDPYYTADPYETETSSSTPDPYYTPEPTTTPTTDDGYYGYPTAITTSLITTSTTLTVYVTSTTRTNDDGKLNIVSAIGGLDDCSVSYYQTPFLLSIQQTSQQDITISSLAKSICNPADFTCICNELQRLAVASSVASNCSPTDAAQFNVFQRDVCRNVQPVFLTNTPSSSTPISSASSAFTPLSHNYSCCILYGRCGQLQRG